MRLALVVSGEVAQIARMPRLLVGQTVLMTFGIVVAARAHAVGRSAVAKLMDVEGVFLPRIQPFNVGDDFHRIAFLREADGAVTFAARGGVQHRDGLFHGHPGFGVLVLSRAQRTG